MASSTTMPIANTKPNMVNVLIVKFKGTKKQKVPKIDTGIASTGIKVERQFCKKRKTTKATRAKVFNKVTTTSCIETFTTVTDSNGTLYCTSVGKVCLSFASSAYTPFAVSSALLPGAWYICR